MEMMQGWRFSIFFMLWHIGHTAADGGDDFANNLISDLGPLISLFGERVTMQFLSQAIGLSDCILVAMAPIGILTVIVSAIRVGGPTWLKAIIGRVRENLSAAEVELMSSTSKEACELWNGQNVVRCQGSARIYQWIFVVPDAWHNEKPCPNVEFRNLGDKEAKSLIFETASADFAYVQNCLSAAQGIPRYLILFFNSLCRNVSRRQEPVIGGSDIEQLNGHDITDTSEELQRRSLRSTYESQNGPPSTEEEGTEPYRTIEESIQSSHTPGATYSGLRITGQESGPDTITILQDDDGIAPNISLNCHERADKTEIYALTLIGVFVQLVIVIYSAIVTCHPSLRGHFLKDDEPVRSYAFPCFAVGTLLLTAGIFLCAFVVDQSTTEKCYEATSGNRIFAVWLQKNHVVNDQVFQPFAVYPLSERKYITVSRRRNGPGNARTSREEARDPLTKSQPNTDEDAGWPLESMTVIGAAIALLGYFLQFTGMRGENWSVSVAQLLGTILMTGLRVWIRRRLAQPPASSRLTSEFELDWFAVNVGCLGGAPWMTMNTEGRTSNPTRVQYMSWFVRSGGSDEHHLVRSPDNDQAEVKPAAQEIMEIRQKLGRLVSWRGPASDEAILLSRAMEIVANAFLPRPTEENTCYGWRLPVTRMTPNSFSRQNELILIKLSLTSEGWKVNEGEIEAILSLWMYSTRKQEDKDASNNCQVSQRADAELRLKEEANFGLRLLGPSNLKQQILRNLQWWMPESVPEVSEIEFTTFRSTVRAESNVQAFNQKISRQRVVGIGMEEQEASFGEALHFVSCPADEVQAEATPKFEKGILAVQCLDTLERLYSRDLFQSFIRTVAKLPHFEGIAVSQVPLVSYKKAEIDQDSFKLKNGKLSGMAEKITSGGFGTLSEVYFDLIVPLTIEQKLSDIECIIQAALEQAQKHEMLCQWTETIDVCWWLFDLASKFDATKEYSHVRALALCLELFCRLLKQLHLQDIERSPALIESFEYVTADVERLGDRFRGQLAIPHLLELIKARGDEEEYKLVSSLGGAVSVDGKAKFPDSFKMAPAHLWALGLGPDGFWSSHDLSKKDALGWTPCHYAASTTRKELLQLASEDEVNALNLFGWRPLHYACLQGNEPMVRLLLNKGASIDVAGSDGVTPMHCAAKKGHLGILKLLLPPPKKFESEATKRDTKQTEPSSDIGRRDYNNRAPIHWAAVEGHISVVKLLEHDINLEDCFGWTCLHIAAVYGHSKLLTHLVGAGANKDQTDHLAYTPLHLTLRCGHVAAALVLLQAGAKANTSTTDGTAPLHSVASDPAMSRVIQTLIDKDVDKDRLDKKHQSPLNVALRYGNEVAATKLVEAGAVFNNGSTYGPGILKAAISNCRVAFLRLLFKSNLKIGDSDSLLETAIPVGDIDILELTIEKIIADSSPEEIAEIRKSGQSLLHRLSHFAPYFGGESADALRALLILLGDEMDFNEMNGGGETLLDVAIARKADQRFIDALVEKGARKSES